MGKEINEKEKAEEELKILNTQLNEAQEIAKMVIGSGILLLIKSHGLMVYLKYMAYHLKIMG